MRSCGDTSGEHDFGIKIIGMHHIEEIFIFLSFIDLYKVDVEIA